MKSVLVHEPFPPELEALIDRRQALGQDRDDEVWEGVYHLTPGPSGPRAYLLHRLDVLLDAPATRAGLVGATGFNLDSGPDDYRVPDSGYLRRVPADVWLPTAAIVVEIVSPATRPTSWSLRSRRCRCRSPPAVPPAVARPPGELLRRPS